jgi:hypothetical protein
MVKVNLRPTRAPILHGMAERTIALTENAPTFINMHKKVVRAALSHNFFGTVSSKFFRRFVPVRNPTFSISEVDTVEKVVHDLFEETVRFICERSCKKWNWRLHVFSPSSRTPTCPTGKGSSPIPYAAGTSGSMKHSINQRFLFGNPDPCQYTLSRLC